jgi:hypothetical protein
MKKKLVIFTIFIFYLSSALHSQESIELSDLIKKFTPDSLMNYNLYSWFTGSEQNSGITWLTDGVDMDDDYNSYRDGEVVVSLKGKTIECLGKYKYPCKWNLRLKGVRNGYTKFSISSVISTQLDGAYRIEDLLYCTDYTSRIIALDNIFNVDGFIIYSLKFENKKEIWIKYWWSCGSSGCSMNIDCYTDFKQIGYILHKEEK